MTYTVQFADNEFLLNDSSHIWYGDAGIGKTTIAMTMPNPLFLIMRGGGEHRPAPLVGSGTPYIEIQTKQEIDEIVLELKRDGHLNVPKMPDLDLDLKTALDRSRKSQLYETKTLIIDQLPSMYNIYMDRVLTSVTRTRDNPATPNQQDYGQVLREFSNFIIEINRIPNMHKVYLALAEIDEDKKTGDRYGAPSVPGKLALDILKYADFVFRMFVQRKVVGNKIIECRVFQTQPDGIWRAKDSTGRLPKFIDLPDPKFDFWNEVIVKALKA